MFYPAGVARYIDPRSGGAHLEDRAIETRRPFAADRSARSTRRMFGIWTIAIRAPGSSRRILHGCHPEMADEDVDYVIDSFHQFFRNCDGEIKASRRERVCRFGRWRSAPER